MKKKRYIVQAEAIGVDENVEELGAPGVGMGGTGAKSGQPGSTTLPGGDEEREAEEQDWGDDDYGDYEFGGCPEELQDEWGNCPGDYDYEGPADYGGYDSETEVAPPGMEPLVKKLKKDPDVDNPFAIAWAQYNRTHKKEGRRVVQAEAIEAIPEAPHGALVRGSGKVEEIPVHAFKDDLQRKVSLRKMMVPDKGDGPRDQQAEAGTSDGAKKGWITRKGGGGSQEKPAEWVRPSFKYYKPAQPTTYGGKGFHAKQVGGSQEKPAEWVRPSFKYYKPAQPTTYGGKGFHAKQVGGSQEKPAEWVRPSFKYYKPAQPTTYGGKGFHAKQVEAQILPEHHMSPQLFLEHARRYAEVGSSAGAKKGWVTRRGGAPSEEPKKEPSEKLVSGGASQRVLGRSYRTGHDIMQNTTTGQYRMRVMNGPFEIFSGPSHSTPEDAEKHGIAQMKTENPELYRRMGYGS
jgi:hypothetical protein